MFFLERSIRYQRHAGAAVWALCVVLGLGCGAEPEGSESEDLVSTPESPALSVYVVNYPLAYLAERIGGDAVNVELPAPPDVDPAYWSPDLETIVAYQGADLVLLNGAGYAGWLELVSLPRARLVDTSASFPDQLIPLEGGPVHTHGPQGEHSHNGYAFTTWLDPDLAAEQARAIAKALSDALPEEVESFGTALAELEADLSDIDRRAGVLWSRFGDRPVLFSHPVYQYLERRYGLNGRSLHWEPDAAPTEEMWSELESLLESHPARWMIWEDEPLAATRARLESLGVGVLVLRPAANVPEAGDLVANLEADLAVIEAALALGL